MAHPSIEELIPEKSMGDDYFKLFKGLTKRMIASHQSIFINLEKLVNRRLVYQPKICQLHCWPDSCFTSHHILSEITAGVREFFILTCVFLRVLLLLAEVVLNIPEPG